MNITLSVDDAVVKKVREIALQKDTTLTAMVREYLIEVAERDYAARRESASRIREMSARYSVDMGERTWTREDLYDRPKRFHQ